MLYYAVGKIRTLDPEKGAFGLFGDEGRGGLTWRCIDCGGSNYETVVGSRFISTSD